jgi:tetraacyldisaccharide 4'-kinase
MSDPVSGRDRVSDWRHVLTPLAWIWRAGHAIDFALAMRTRRTLRTPVVSVGALTMGGAGKSPMVAHLAARLREMGRNPAILTRGYRRISREPMVIVRRGDGAPVERTGDEAQMFVRAGDAHVGIGADRYAVGRRMEQELAPDIFLLDDGFQHVQLNRSHDVVLIDAADPLAGGVFPVGRLREPPSALKRATEIVVTNGPDISEAVKLIERMHLRVAVYGSHVIPLQWMDLESGALGIEANPGRVAAFCGLGNPRSFWGTLDRLPVEIAMRREFADHHRYRPAELKLLAREAAAQGARALVTTEKDAMNLCSGAPQLVAPLKLYWLKIGIEIAYENKLLGRITEKA